MDFRYTVCNILYDEDIINKSKTRFFFSCWTFSEIFKKIVKIRNIRKVTISKPESYFGLFILR